MSQIIGVCGYYSSGSSAVLDLLHEFSETQVLDGTEFSVSYAPDGLCDLERGVNQYAAYGCSHFAIRRFIDLMSEPSPIHQKFKAVTKGRIDELTAEFVSEITQVKWRGYITLGRAPGSRFWPLFRKLAFKAARLASNIFGNSRIAAIASDLYAELISCDRMFSVFPEDFMEHAKAYAGGIMAAMGRDERLVTVLDKPFAACNPIACFRFFDNPKAIVVDRDPRDVYLFVKNFMGNPARGSYTGGRVIPTDNVEDFIRFYRLSRQSPAGMAEREDILFIRFESLLYDYESSVKTIANFIGIADHARRGEIFIPARSRCNSQLFKKYTGFEEDIAKIEAALPEYLFPFEEHQDIEAAGEMFYGRSKLSNKR